MITIITSLYKSDYYINDFSKNLKIFADKLNKNNIQFEYLVIANEPTPKEQQFAKDFGQFSWFNFFSVNRETLYASWNRGVEMAKGEIIGFWNVDDKRYGQGIVEANKLFKNGADLVYFPFKINKYISLFGNYIRVYQKTINTQIPEFSQSTKPEFLKSMLCGPFFMFTKAFFSKVGPFDEQFRIAGDFDWCIRSAKISNNLVKSKELGGEFRVDGGGLSAGANDRLVVENNVVYSRHNIKEKLQNINSELSKQYDPAFIKSNNKQIKYV